MTLDCDFLESSPQFRYRTHRDCMGTLHSHVEVAFIKVIADDEVRVTWCIFVTSTRRISAAKNNAQDWQH